MEDMQYLTVKEAAQRLRLSTKTIHRWIASGKLKAMWLGSDRAGWRIRPADLDAALTPGRTEVERQQRMPLQEQRDQGKLAA